MADISHAERQAFEYIDNDDAGGLCALLESSEDVLNGLQHRAVSRGAVWAVPVLHQHNYGFGGVFPGYAGVRYVHYAAQTSASMLEALFKTGVDLTARDDVVDTETGVVQGATAAHYAAGQGRADSLRVLASHGVDLGMPDLTGITTPAMIAATRGHPECIRVLNEHGVSVRAINVDGLTPAHLAANHGHIETLEAIGDAGGDVIDFRDDDDGDDDDGDDGDDPHLPTVYELLQQYSSLQTIARCVSILTW
jgi:phage tail protein X